MAGRRGLQHATVSPMEQDGADRGDQGRASVIGDNLGPPEPLSEAAREIALEALKFHHDRQAAGSDSVTTIGQNIFILIGAGLIAATQVREALVFIPLFWSAWMLHSLQRSRDSIKHQVYARALEDLINSSLERRVHLWNRALTTEALTPPITVANYAYWLILNLSSWVIGVVVLFKGGRPWLAAGLIILGLAVYAVTAFTLATNKRFEQECQSTIENDLGAPGSSWRPRYGRWQLPSKAGRHGTQ